MKQPPPAQRRHLQFSGAADSPAVPPATEHPHTPVPFPPYRAHVSQSGDSWFWKEATPLPLILELGEPGSQPSLWKGLTCLNSLRFMELILKMGRGDVWTLPLEPASSLKKWEKPVHIQNTPPGGWQGVRWSGSPFPHTPISPHSDPSEKGSPPTGCTQQAADFPMFSEPPSLENRAPLCLNQDRGKRSEFFLYLLF